MKFGSDQTADLNQLPLKRLIAVRNQFCPLTRAVLVKLQSGFNCIGVVGCHGEVVCVISCLANLMVCSNPIPGCCSLLFCN